jgi:hypothetical protein
MNNISSIEFADLNDVFSNFKNIETRVVSEAIKNVLMEQRMKNKNTESFIREGIVLYNLKSNSRIRRLNNLIVEDTRIFKYNTQDSRDKTLEDISRVLSLLKEDKQTELINIIIENLQNWDTYKKDKIFTNDLQKIISNYVTFNLNLN